MSFDYLRAIKRPFTDFNKLSIGIIFLIIPFINIITSFLVKGYRLEAARTSFNKKFEMPKWENFGNLFVRGLLSFVIAIIYMLPAMILILIAVGKILYNIIMQYGFSQGFSLSNSLSDQLIQNNLLQNIAMIPVFIVGVLLALLAAYLGPIAVMKYAEKYKFNSAFKLGEVFKKAFKGPYFIAILAIILYSIIISLISSALSLGFAAINVQFLTIALNLIVSGLASFIVIVTSYTIIGEVYSKLK